LNDDKSTNGGETGNFITIDKLQNDFPRVELATINKALPGDRPYYLKIKIKKIEKYLSPKQ
jgi:hypothetical protein